MTQSCEYCKSQNDISKIESYVLCNECKAKYNKRTSKCSINCCVTHNCDASCCDRNKKRENKEY